MSGKRNISFTKPQDPSFLAKLKAQIGYREGPTVETKRQKLEDFNSDSSDVEERPEHDEKPQIVVLQSGDLTAEEVAKEESRIAREAAEAPADLTKPIVFQKRKATKEDSEAIASANSKSKNSSSNNAEANKVSQQKVKKSKRAQQSQKSKLSFNDDDDDDNAEEDT